MENYFLILLSHLDKIPPCTAGCKVFTRPPSISGAPDISETSLTGIPVFLILLAVPPLATNVNPKLFNSVANSIKPVLSETDSKARKMRKEVNCYNSLTFQFSV